ncbi:hypothetical protein ERO13_D13G035700v2 [Gossypium hirsutum]|uniref:Uncharacterized protein n=7 Tax=Gossypium TaxID=3633 RepID=A0A5J5NH29_GOSBA|nr:hypothetical protein ES319_D13G040700v1 [Gossypium barbadense]KAG4110220.1 hypothetical protein ERO13_D13G035700v2 [Gossypium hirsutum]TYG36155.1 hypothetical protein ES288_D13G041900v1 [Gossypium darwinii]TYH33182.1 hypothetical protein ES332_D13G040700v1 [Gossypium tomentosum]TYI45504.1 hypothetical protein E1A91_D13G041400v1 [Gossypium mustelinum]
MVLQRLEMCVEMVKLVIKFVIVVAEAVGIVIHQNDSNRPVIMSMPIRSHAAPSVPFVGFLP